MKLFCYVFFAFILLAGCKKNGDSSPQFLLSKILVNGIPQEEYVYENRDRLKEIRLYEEVQGAAVLTNVYRYNYDAAGKLKEELQIDAETNKTDTRGVISVDAAGRIQRIAYYAMAGADSGKLYTNIDHEYNADSRLVKQTWKDKNEKVASYREIAYYADGNLKDFTVYDVIAGVPSKFFSYEYGKPDTTLPPSFYMQKAFPVNYHYPYLVSATIDYYGYKNDGVNEHTKETPGKREYNADGLVIKQTIGAQKILPVGLAASRTEIYEYIKL